MYTAKCLHTRHTYYDNSFISFKYILGDPVGLYCLFSYLSINRICLKVVLQSDELMKNLIKD